MTTKPKLSSSLNPWEALLSSATRTRPSDTSNSSFLLDGDGYTILLQHSMTSKSQRQFALESTIANVDSGAGNSSSGSKGTVALSSQFASSLSITQQKQNTSSQRRAGGDWYGMSGPFLIRQAFLDLCKRCTGRVVLVSVVGTSAIWDLNAEDYGDAAIRDDSEDYHHQHQSSGDNDSGDNLRDAMNSFRQNGACVDLSSNPFGWNNDNNNTEANTTLHNLQSVVTAIQQAASRIESSDQTQHQQPIPVIFDSLTPLLHLHGAERITIMLKSLGRRRGASSSPLQHDNSSTATSSSSCLLSPIVAPVLHESICLSDHRTLEDCADAMVSLNLMNSTTTASTKDDNSIAVASGVLDLVRKGGGAIGLGGKLMRHCVPVHIFRSLSATGDLRDGCYWIIDDGGSNDDNAVRDDDDAAEKKGRKQTTSASSSGEAAQTQSEASLSSRPKIYLEDDDPEFEDYDEDDDLDL